MKIKSKKYIKKKYKSNKNTNKYKNMRIRKRTKKITKITKKITKKITNKSRNKSKKMKGGGPGGLTTLAAKIPGGDLSKIVDAAKAKVPGPIEGELIKSKGMAMKLAPSLNAIPSPMGLSKIASSASKTAGDSFKKMMPTGKEISKSLLPKNPKSIKDAGLSALSMIAKPVIVPWRFTKAILSSMRNIATATLVMPTLSMNQILPPELCKFYLKNDRICSQTVSEYLFKGSKAEFEKRDLTTKDNEECMVFNPDTNKYEQCKPDKMKGGGIKKELIITCKEKIKHGLYKNDRVMIYIELPTGQDAIVANKIGENVYIGKILSISGSENTKFEIELENSEEEPITVTYDKNDPNIMKYDKNFQSFLSEFEKYFQDMYKDDIKWSKESNKNLNLFLLGSLYALLGSLAISTVIGLSAALGISLTGIGTVGLGVGIAVGPPVLVLLLCCKIYVKIAEMSPSRKSIYLATMKRLIDDDKVKEEKKNLYILQQLVKINHNLRLYKCPKDKLESIFEMIRDVELLKKIKNIAEQFLEGVNETHDESQGKCDTDYDALSKGNPLLTKFELKPDIEYVHTKNHLFNYFRPLHVEPEEKPACKKINRLKPANILASFTKTISGDKDNIAHIVINVFQGISSSDGDIYDNTKEILKNIQCRTGLIDIIKNRIAAIEKAKKAQEDEDEAKKAEKAEKAEKSKKPKSQK